MKLRLLLPLLCAALCTGGAELSLAELPATAERAFWTWDGTRFPLRGRNLSGGPIRIGRTEYAAGLCGHTPFSCVYRTDARAEAFSAEIGVEATDHARDPILPGDPPPAVTFRFFADFREVRRVRRLLGQPPEPVRIDLRGVRHFEIRAQASGGRTSHRCRTALGNPVFSTEDPDALRRALAGAAAGIGEAPIFPPAPRWRGSTPEKIRFAGYAAGAYRFRTGQYELVLAPECAGRMLWFSRPGGPNLLAPELPVPRKEALIPGGYPDFATGRFLRILPDDQLIPGDPVLETAPFSIDFPEENLVVMRSAESRVHEVSFEYRCRLLPDGVAVTGIIRNLSSFPRSLGCWSLARADARKLRSVEIPGRAAILPETIPPEGYETGASAPARMTALFDTGERLTITGPEEKCAVKLYRTGRFVELELLGECVSVPPGGTVRLRERWTLRRPFAESR